MKIVSYIVIIIISGRLVRVYVRCVFVCVCVCMFEIAGRERERGENRAKKMSTTNNDASNKLDDFSHAKIHRHHASATAAAAVAITVEKDDEEARNASSRFCSVDFHFFSRLHSIARSHHAHN